MSRSLPSCDGSQWLDASSLIITLQLKATLHSKEYYWQQWQHCRFSARVGICLLLSGWLNVLHLNTTRTIVLFFVLCNAQSPRSHWNKAIGHWPTRKNISFKLSVIERAGKITHPLTNVRCPQISLQLLHLKNAGDSCTTQQTRQKNLIAKKVMDRPLKRQYWTSILPSRL